MVEVVLSRQPGQAQEILSVILAQREGLQFGDPVETGERLAQRARTVAQVAQRVRMDPAAGVVVVPDLRLQLSSLFIPVVPAALALSG